VTADEIADPQDLKVRLWVGGARKQDFSTSDMAHKRFAEKLANVSFRRQFCLGLAPDLRSIAAGKAGRQAIFAIRADSPPDAAINFGKRTRLYAIRVSRKSPAARTRPRCLVLRIVPCCLPKPNTHSIMARRDRDIA
jgi:hypothetical protein